MIGIGPGARSNGQASTSPLSCKSGDHTIFSKPEVAAAPVIATLFALHAPVKDKKKKEKKGKKDKQEKSW